MDAKDFIFPGVILALVVVVGVGLLLTHSSQPALVTPMTPFATSTVSTISPSASTTAPASAAPAAPPSTYAPITGALGQAAHFPDGLSVLPMRVLQDSRCPSGTECIHTGTVQVAFSATLDGKTTSETLDVGQGVKVGSDTVTLASVAPAKPKSGYPAASEYRFTFTVSHG